MNGGRLLIDLYSQSRFCRHIDKPVRLGEGLRAQMLSYGAGGLVELHHRLLHIGLWIQRRRTRGERRRDTLDIFVDRQPPIFVFMPWNPAST